jgi:SAM-dependent methyltransferase
MLKQALHKILHFNSSRVRLWQENKAFADAVPAGAMVLDAGSGSSPYRDLFRHALYESADFQQVNKEYAPPTYTCDLKEIPVENERYDFVVFNQVMEHLPEPGLVLAELHRVLKPNGKMIYTGPLFYQEHEVPYDFYRYTQFGLRYLFSKYGFSVQRLDWMEGYFGTIGYQLRTMAIHLPWKPRQISPGLKGFLLMPVMMVLKPVFAANSLMFHAMEMQTKFTAGGYPKNYVVIVVKSMVDA